VYSQQSRLRAQRKNYHTVFARDAGLCVLAMVRSGDPELVEGSRKSLLTLALDQAENGKFPSSYRPQNRMPTSGTSAE
jgi:hypothetical protein